MLMLAKKYLRILTLYSNEDISSSFAHIIISCTSVCTFIPPANIIQWKADNLITLCPCDVRWGITYSSTV